MNLSSTIRESQEKQRRHYDQAFRLGCPWDTPLQPILWNLRFELTRKYLTSGAVVLDLGCGEGTISRCASPLVKQVVAVDISAEAVRVVREGSVSYSNMEYVVRSLEDFLSRQIQTVDVCLMFEVIEHLADVGLVLDLLRRWLDPSGVLVLITPNRNKLTARIRNLLRTVGVEPPLHEREPGIHEYEFTPSELEILLNAHGFKVQTLSGAVIGPELLFGARWSFLHRVNAKLGQWMPRLAAYTFVVARQ
jgi:2-polyprenyl-3-methyl-5-hydroxy-6-metoxy-1,4-benzoquinol methylase